MGPLQRSRATLRITGDDLVPDEVSQLLGGRPTRSQTKGDAIPTASGGVRIARWGSWNLDATPAEPEDLDGQVQEILDQLTADREVWKALRLRFKVDLFCGWFMGSRNEGVGIDPRTLLALGRRGIELGLDIYGPDRESGEA